VATGTIVDATIINAPASAKNVNKARDPEMHHPPSATPSRRQPGLAEVATPQCHNLSM
jgi:hypothetical protein